ncbi:MULTISPECIES: coenzyme F430 synthase [Methanocalculus]|nr:coenzyme F430 synthase [Methanocalculus sp. MSAO_Arc1]MCP1661833.1 hypothetical protein [Methanocalculus sp. AMF5]
MPSAIISDLPMRLLILDTIHGGGVIASALREQGLSVDCVDVYRGSDGISIETAQNTRYSCCIAPVHLDPAHPLLHAGIPVISHHLAAGMLIGDNPPEPFIEITGERGKTTTAFALAHLMPERGVLHSSSGTIRYPEMEMISRSSITPASLLAPAAEARAMNGWFIGECSLGVSGRGDLGILTSDTDYRIANGKSSALAAKLEHLKTCKQLLLPDGIRGIDHPDQHRVGAIASCDDTTVTYEYKQISGSFTNPLLSLKGYQEPLTCAAAAACLLGTDPAPLARFNALPGRMRIWEENGCIFVDASNSGTNRETTREAAAYARRNHPGSPLHLVIGQDEHAVCENFADADIRMAIEEIEPDKLTIVQRNQDYDFGSRYPESDAKRSLDEAIRDAARKPGSIILLAVKTWR